MEVRDSVFAFEIARRAVGRAALHLGVESMDEEALDTLSDVLLAYLGRYSKLLAATVESSGRSSAHVHVLDALAAAELSTSPAVSRLHVDNNDDDDNDAVAGGADTDLANGGDEKKSGKGAAAAGQGDNNNNNASISKEAARLDWKGLAAFCFGPHWRDKVPEEDQRIEARAAGGKQGPSTVPDAKNLPKAGGGGTSDAAGWKAPYLEDVPFFPVASEKCANPHGLQASVAISLHPLASDDEDDAKEDVASKSKRLAEEGLQDLPDAVFTDGIRQWGALAGTKRKNMDESKDDMEVDSPPPLKKVRISDDGKRASSAKSGETEQNIVSSSKLHHRRPLYVPPFYPAPPQRPSEAKNPRIVADVPEEASAAGGGSSIPDATATSDTQWTEHGDVRSSLVHLGQYWGSGWDADHPSTALLQKKVPLGRIDASAVDDRVKTVIPLTRASGSRVARILEGSMDAAAMQ